MQISLKFLFGTFVSRTEALFSQELSTRSFNGVFNYRQNITPCSLLRIAVPSVRTKDCNLKEKGIKDVG
jgi:hypothetical protein